MSDKESIKSGELPTHILTSEEQAVAEKRIQENLAARRFDPNLAIEVVENAESALEKGDVKAEAALEDWLENESPYEEVRAAASNIDDPTMPVNTFRAWFLGILFTVILNFVDQFLYYRYPSVRISALVVQLVTLPLGKLMARTLPTKEWQTPFGPFSLNPGPFNSKEHTLITLMANVTYQGAYATDILAAQKFFYGQETSWNYSILIVMSTQIIGFSYAGFSRKWLVWPAAAIWPSALVQTALMTAFHGLKSGKEGGPSRFRWFVYIFVGAFFYYFLPGYLFSALSVFTWATWIAPNNIKLNQLMGGGGQGLGIGALTFDWSQASYIGSPLVTPWWAEANIFAGLVGWFWILAPILYYRNAFNSAYLPIISSKSYDRFGNRYNTTRILTPEKTFDVDLYNAYSTQYLPITLVISYGLSFAALTSLIVHIYLYYRHDLKRQFKAVQGDSGSDVHARLMSKYSEVPVWWYAVTGLVSLVFGIIAIEVYHTQMPIWALFLALVIGAGFTIPIGIILAITNQELGLNIITEFLIGYMVPGKPVSMMLFKTYGYISMYQALSFVSDQKFAHYMKIPPKSTFLAQLIATIVANLVVVGTQLLAFDVIKGVCTAEAQDHFICPGTTVFSTASVIWGLIGPSYNFSAGKRYVHILWFFLVGAVVPIPTYFLTKKFPRSFLRYVNWPVIFSGLGLLPPATGLNYVAFCTVGFIFNYLIRKYRFEWWSNYNYVTSAGLDAGTGICTLVIFFCLVLPDGPQQFIDWWGNNVFTETADYNFTPWLTAPDQGFAPAPNGSY